jgi:uncharacterized delta-60 repeat protein
MALVSLLVILCANEIRAFAPEVGFVYASAIQPDGKIIIAGTFLRIDDEPQQCVGRLNSDGTRDATFQPVVFNDSTVVHAIALQADGKLVIAGDFLQVNSVSRSGIARLNTDGTLDAGFNPGSGLAGGSRAGFALGIQPDGKIVVAGDFFEVAGQPRSCIARLNADGSLDASFAPGTGLTGGSGTAFAIAIQADGRVIVAGSFSAVNGLPRSNIARLETNGTVDTTYDPDIDANVFAMQLQADGKLLVGGEFNNVGSSGRNSMARLETTGAADAAYNPNVDDWVRAIAVDAAGRAVITGRFATVGGMVRNDIARLETGGGLDTNFNSGLGFGDGRVGRTIAIQADGRLIVGGWFGTVDDVYRVGLARLNSDGSLEVADGPDYSVGALARLSDGRMIVGGAFATIGNVRRRRIARVNLDLTADTSFDPGAGVAISTTASGNLDGRVYSTAVQTDGKILISGNFDRVDGQPRTHLARLHADGSLDTTFNPAINDIVTCMVVQTDGKIVLSGLFTEVNGQACAHVARLNSDGSRDTGFTPPHFDFPVFVMRMAIQPDGKILVGGTFSTVQGQTRHGVARLETNGDLDTSFNAGLPATGAINVSAIKVLANGSIMLAGKFNSVGGTPRVNLARVTSTGALDPTFDAGPGPNDLIASIEVQPDGRILISGTFSEFNGSARSCLARINADGTLDATFNPQIGGTHSKGVGLMLLPDGKIVIGGRFKFVNGTAINNLACLNSDGTLAASAAPPGPPVVTGAAPNPVAAGANLTITGTELGGATAVSIGGVAAAILTNTPTQISVAVSSGQPVGAGQAVSVTTPTGTHNTFTIEVIAAPPSPPPGGGGGSSGGGGGCAAGVATLPALLPLLALIAWHRRSKRQA